ncbi:MAG: glycosyltransferase [Flavobacteriaceae bacterium]|nr:MAG: glycosyltransferase [Flavobacteriaceae bacterium]
MQQNNALIIFTRDAVLGKVKTRLAKELGDVATLKIYKRLLEHTKEVSRDIQATKFIFYTDSINTNDLWTTAYHKKEQKGSDIGLRMYNAIQEILNLGYKKVVLIGSDNMEITQTIIEEAFEKLENYKYVLGPALDGGYYLIGSKTNDKKLFLNKEWSTSTVLENTLNDLKNVPYHLLKTLNDIDTIHDLESSIQLKTYLKRKTQ